MVEATSCSFLPKAAVEIWHADADTARLVTFRTVYPGGTWAARPTSLKVHVGGNIVHSQLFFDEAINDAVYAPRPTAATRSSAP